MNDISKCESLLFGKRKKSSTGARSVAPPPISASSDKALMKRSRGSKNVTSPKYVLPPIEPEASSSLTELYNVPEDVTAQYMRRYNMKRVFQVSYPLPEADCEELMDMWNSWAFPFRQKSLYGKLGIHGLSLPTKKEILAMHAISAFISSRFVAATHSNTSFTDIATYVRAQCGPDIWTVCTDAVLIIVLWKLQFHDPKRWLHMSQISDLPIRARFIDNPYVFEKTISTHADCTVSISWVHKLCATAFTFFEVGGRSAKWRVQFTGMETYLPAAFSYFVATRAHPDNTERASAKDVFKALQIASLPPIQDITDASYAEMRLGISEYTNDFTWLFACAHALAIGSVDARIDAIRHQVLVDNSSWDTIQIASPSVVLESKSPTFSTVVPSGIANMFCATAEPHALCAMQWLLEDENRMWIKVKNRGAYYKDLDFDTTRFAPLEETQFMSNISHVELHGAFDALDAAFSDNNADAAFVVASVLLNMDVNAVFAFIDCPPRKQLRDVLAKYLRPCPHVTCTHVNDTSFLSHASSALWWWLFTQCSAFSEKSRLTMAYICEIASRYPDLEQLSLWSAFVRALDANKMFHAHAVSLADMSSDDPSAGKLVGVCRKTPVYEPISEDNICSANTLFRSHEAGMRAHAALANPSTYVLFSAMSKSIQQRAILERILLRGDWENADCVNCIHAILYGGSSAEDDPGVPVDAASSTASIYQGMEHVVVQVVDKTASMPVLQTNAVLTYLHPVQIVESLIERFSNRVQWV